MRSKAKLQVSIISILVLLGFMALLFWQIFAMAPNQVHAEIGGVRLGITKPVYLPGEMLSCQSVTMSTQCQLKLVEGKEVDIQVLYHDAQKTGIAGCTAHYNGRSLSCQAVWTLQHTAPYVVLNDDFDLSLAQWEQLRQENFFWQWTEADWLKGVTVLGIVFSLMGAVLLGLWVDGYLKGKNVSRPAFYLISSLATFTAVRFVLLMALLWLGFID